MYTIGMAYCGSGNNTALKRLLHIAVSHAFAFHVIGRLLTATYLISVGLIKSSFLVNKAGVTLIQQSNVLEDAPFQYSNLMYGEMH